MKRNEVQAAYDALTPSQQLILARLDKMVDELGDAGVDTSYFPESAQLVLIKWAKEFQDKE